MDHLSLFLYVCVWGGGVEKNGLFARETIWISCFNLERQYLPLNDTWLTDNFAFFSDKRALMDMRVNNVWRASNAASDPVKLKDCGAGTSLIFTLWWRPEQRYNQKVIGREISLSVLINPLCSYFATLCTNVYLQAICFTSLLFFCMELFQSCRKWSNDNMLLLMEFKTLADFYVFASCTRILSHKYCCSVSRL